MSTAAALQFACDGCGKQYKWKPEIAGKRAKCTCGSSMQVPTNMPDGGGGVATAVAPAPAPAKPAAAKPVTTTVKPGLAAAGVKVAPVAQKQGAPVTAKPAVTAAAPKAVAPPPPPVQEQEDDGLYDFAEDDQPKFVRAPAPEDDVPVAAAIPTAVPIGRSSPHGRSIGYASAGSGISDLPLLGDADLDWVMKLRNAARLMVSALSFNFLAHFFLPSGDAIEAGVGVIVAAMNILAAWLLTAPEPGVPGSGIFSSRMFLRVTACAAGAGQVLTAVGGLLSSEEHGMSPLVGVGGLIYLVAGVPSIFLFLWYLAKLAKRIPSPGLAINCYIVMIGLPSVVAASTLGGILALSAKSPAMGILTLVGGVLGFLIFRLWYIIILIWFNRSFS